MDRQFILETEFKPQKEWTQSQPVGFNNRHKDRQSAMKEAERILKDYSGIIKEVHIYEFSSTVRLAKENELTTDEAVKWLMNNKNDL